MNEFLPTGKRTRSDEAPVQQTTASTSLSFHRSHFEHICFVDLDVCSKFFRYSDERHFSISPLTPPGVFFWFFCTSNTILRRVIGASVSFYSLLMRKMIEVVCTNEEDLTEDERARAKSGDLAEAHLLKKMLELHETLHSSIPFTFLCDGLELKRLQSEKPSPATSWFTTLFVQRDVFHMRPTRLQWTDPLSRRLMGQMAQVIQSPRSSEKSLSDEEGSGENNLGACAEPPQKRSIMDRNGNYTYLADLRRRLLINCVSNGSAEASTSP